VSATPVRQRGAAALILGLYAILVLLRIPHIVSAGRFWAEEGTVFYAQAAARPPLDVLFMSYGGYLNLAANAGAVLARRVVPLEFAPFVTIAIGLLFQLLPPLLLLTARDPWLRDWRVRSAGLLLLLFVPAADEIWLQTLHCQFELTLASALVLALEVPRGGQAALPLAVLGLAPLCGPGAIVLLPLFALRSALERSRGRALQTAVLLGATIVQLVFFYHRVPGRTFSVDPAALLTVVAVKHLAVPFLGIHTATALASAWRETLASGRIPLGAMLASGAAVLGIAGVTAREQNLVGAWLLAAAALVGGASYVGGLDGAVVLVHPFVGERYAFVPQSLLGLALLSLAAGPAGWVRGVAAVACLWLLIVGVQQYRRPWSAAAQGPDWRAQVAAWRTDPSHALLLWPQGWTMTLESGHD